MGRCSGTASTDRLLGQLPRIVILASQELVRGSRGDVAAGRTLEPGPCLVKTPQVCGCEFLGTEEDISVNGRLVLAVECPAGCQQGRAVLVAR